VEPTSNCSSASGGALFAGAAAVMQAVESQTLILYHTDLRGQWPQAGAQAFAARLPYARRLRVRADHPAQRASLAGTALALRALSRLTRRTVRAGEIVFAAGQKPRLAAAGARAAPGPDFSVSHSGPWVGCAAVARGCVGFDVELGAGARSAQWVLLEAALKATGEGVRALHEVRALRARAGQLRWRGQAWQVHRLEVFTEAAACIVTSLPAAEIETRAIALEELFSR
jgi:phosphopantetheinyl transferase